MLERIFRLRANGTNVRTEVLGGLTTFMTMAYIVFVLLTFLHIREMIIDAIPASLRFAIPVGIGLFIALMGLKSAGIVVVPAAGSLPVMGYLGGAPTVVALVGVVVTVALLARRVPFSSAS